jgi:hypothetical protein
LIVILYGDAAMDTIAGDNNNKIEVEDDLFSFTFDAVMRGGNPLREDEYCDIHIPIPLSLFPIGSDGQQQQQVIHSVGYIPLPTANAHHIMLFVCEKSDDAKEEQTVLTNTCMILKMRVLVENQGTSSRIIMVAICFGILQNRDQFCPWKNLTWTYCSLPRCCR